MRALTATSPLPHRLPRPLRSSSSLHQKTRFVANPTFRRPIPASVSKSASYPISEDELEPEPEFEAEAVFEDGFEIEIAEGGKKNQRIIRARIRVDADLEIVWSVLTDYEGLADFIPSLEVSRLVERGEKFARLYQVGKQDLALGLTFDAKGVLDCYERDMEHLQSGRRRDIDFKMIEGDFKIFEGRWSIEQIDNHVCKEGKLVMGQEFQTTLSYYVELEPKLWLPVRLLEGRLCKEVKNNLLCVREEAQRIQKFGAETLATTWDTRDDGIETIG